MTEIRSNTCVALGANLPSSAGSSRDTLVAAVAAMAERGLLIRAVSRFFTTPCYPPGTGPDYVNAAVKVACDLAPEALLGVLHEIEASFGRERQLRWGMRTLDLDLLMVDDVIAPDPATHDHWRDLDVAAQRRIAPEGLILPHPRLQDRGFVLVPLADIAPDWVHPVLRQPVSALLAALPAGDLAQIRPI